jgi:hypothetical protein
MDTLKKQLTWQVVSDNAGGLHLAVWDDDTLIYTHSGYEYNDGQLRQDLIALADGSHPIADDWAGNEGADEARWDWDAESRRNGGWAITVDDYQVTPWGCAAHCELLPLYTDARFTLRSCVAGCDDCDEVADAIAAIAAAK